VHKLFVKGSGVGVLQLWDYQLLDSVCNLVLQKQHSLGELNLLFSLSLRLWTLGKSGYSARNNID